MRLAARLEHQPKRPAWLLRIMNDELKLWQMEQVGHVRCFSSPIASKIVQWMSLIFLLSINGQFITCEYNYFRYSFIFDIRSVDEHCSGKLRVCPGISAQTRQSSTWKPWEFQTIANIDFGEPFDIGPRFSRCQLNRLIICTEMKPRLIERHYEFPWLMFHW
jgi:hypothetical protein